MGSPVLRLPGSGTWHCPLKSAAQTVTAQTVTSQAWQVLLHTYHTTKACLSAEAAALIHFSLPLQLRALHSHTSSPTTISSVFCGTKPFSTSQLAPLSQWSSNHTFLYIKPRHSYWPWSCTAFATALDSTCKIQCLLPSTETSRDLTRSLLFPTRIIGISSVCLARLNWILSSEAFSKLTLSVTE